MKPGDRDKIHNFLVFGIVVLISAFVFLAMGESVFDLSVKKSTYVDGDLAITFKYPASFKVRKTALDNIALLEIYPFYLDGEFEPRFIEIAVGRDSKEGEGDLDRQVAEVFTGDWRNRIQPIVKPNAAGVQVHRVSSDERAIYSYFKHSGNTYLVKFYQLYYGTDYPAMAISNNPYTGAYYHLLHSLEFI